MEDMFVVVLPKRLWSETKFELGQIDNGSWMINICNNCMQIFSTTNVCMDNEQQAHELKKLPKILCGPFNNNNPQSSQLWFFDD
jgi:hypothetical protein